MQHLTHCACCAAEARAYAQLGALLADGREVESSPPEWDRMRASLSERREVARPGRSRLKPAAACGLAAVMLSLAFVMWPRTGPAVEQPTRANQVAETRPGRTPDIRPSQPKAGEQPRRITQPRRDRIHVLRRYKPWKLTAEAEHPQSTEHPVAAVKDEAQPPRDVAVIDIARDSEQGSTDKYVIDVVAMDGSDSAPL